MALQAQKQAGPASLAGPAAEAIRHALHMEGILQDMQERVLKRLQEEAAWLADVTKESAWVQPSQEVLRKQIELENRARLIGRVRPA